MIMLLAFAPYSCASSELEDSLVENIHVRLLNLIVRIIKTIVLNHMPLLLINFKKMLCTITLVFQ